MASFLRMRMKADPEPMPVEGRLANVQMAHFVRERGALAHSTRTCGMVVPRLKSAKAFGADKARSQSDLASISPHGQPPCDSSSSMGVFFFELENK